ncbi:hypothetical protein A7A08_02209 [Methyloligella halotolerans]|uniref:Uncharacterized protein n=1 Tax=Methyloligella halotolerans TaxID=1177755 RepID=A0A1E2RXN7_9HYPH|nr:hypothetical protein [Methyloligella halotolerans]ODA66912.1 hypothetical protein A7A08_02209 [Methyloligella halotolerans]
MKSRLIIAGAIAFGVIVAGPPTVTPAFAANGPEAQTKQQERLLRQERKAQRRAQRQIQRQRRQEDFAEQESRREAFDERQDDRFDDPFFDRRAYWNWRYGPYGDPFYDPYFGVPPGGDRQGTS